MGNDFVESMICRPVGMGGKTLWLDVSKPLVMKQLSQDLKMLFRSEGMTVTSTYSPNILVLQIHARGIRGHYYTVKVCQNQGKVLIETGITSARQQLEWASAETGIGVASDELLHNKFLTLLSGAFAGIDVASVLGSYQQESSILQQIQQVITSYGGQPPSAPGHPVQYHRFCPNCGNPLSRPSYFCPNCGHRL
ncbi:hypothetical protein IC006_0412 [Sulfuracidifex tepidarius]|uniref:Zinc-ribbon domain-containing protein n=1 Tax=Sulfuracidifex tepidarius TaxID=1294262 RepID=A0A510DSH8_9CREN|nr:zinc ribbon domain-containing protein [Sulfuracidifex tepidarius]BBG23128.1 hypothetical protein IC006_0412 [Sulfuracidifex tepidarius]